MRAQLCEFYSLSENVLRNPENSPRPSLNAQASLLSEPYTESDKQKQTLGIIVRVDHLITVSGHLAA